MRGHTVRQNAINYRACVHAAYRRNFSIIAHIGGSQRHITCVLYTCSDTCKTTGNLPLPTGMCCTSYVPRMDLDSALASLLEVSCSVILATDKN